MSCSSTWELLLLLLALLLAFEVVLVWWFFPGLLWSSLVGNLVDLTSCSSSTSSSSKQSLSVSSKSDSVLFTTFLTRWGSSKDGKCREVIFTCSLLLLIPPPPPLATAAVELGCPGIPPPAAWSAKGELLLIPPILGCLRLKVQYIASKLSLMVTRLDNWCLLFNFLLSRLRVS